jgi:hypothetical protein
MKRIATIALSIAATLVASGTAFAQNHTVQATVPFNFTVGSTSLPAGTYTVKNVNSDGTVLGLSNQEQNVATIVMGQADANGAAQNGKMIFHKYGDRYFLSEIRYANSTAKVYFSPTRTEKKAREGVLEGSLSSNDEVLIAMK